MSRLAALFRQPAADPRSDGALLAAFLADQDEPAFAELVRRHGPLVWGACRRGLPDRADAEDAFQTTFLVLVRRARRLTAAGTVGPWLHKVAAWTARNLRRKNARRLARRRELSDVVPDPGPAPGLSFDLDAALLSLPERYRAALVLCCLEGLTHREAAGRLGCAEGTVSSRVSRGLAKLRARLAGRDPAAALAVAAAVLVPSSLSATAPRAAAAFRALSAAASPAVAELTEGVLRMFWVKRATAAGLAGVLLVAAGVGVGVSVRQVPQAAAEDPPARVSAKSPQDPQPELPAAEAELKRLEAMQQKLEAERLLIEAQVAAAKARLAAARKPAGRRLELRVDSRMDKGPYRLTEFRADGRPSAITTFPADGPKDVSTLRDYLARVKAAKDGPKEVTLVCQADTWFEYVKGAMTACEQAGLTAIQVREVTPKAGGDRLAAPTAAEVELQRERVAFTERMVRKGYMTEAQADAEKALLRQMEDRLEAEKRKGGSDPSR
jgi:RNA polymerase sigma factor (sigma-70 family)